jgi:hypothetical protein
MSADEPHGASVAGEGDLVHQTAHQKDAEAASAVVRLDTGTIRGFRKSSAAVFDDNRQPRAVEGAFDGNARLGGSAAVLDGVVQRLAGGKADIREGLFGKTALARKRRNSLARHRDVSNVARVGGVIVLGQDRLCVRVHNSAFPARATLNLTKGFAACAFLFAIVACQPAGSLQAPSPAGFGAGTGAEIGPRSCSRRVNDTLAKLEACIQRATLWRRLARFQRIADQNPGTQGHGNRDTGTPGYAASVAYVAGLMRKAGYGVTIQQYVYKKSEVVGVPQFRSAGRAYAPDRDWYVARLSGAGTLTAPALMPRGSPDGCSPTDFAGFTRGDVALLRNGECDFDTQVENAQAAGAAGVVLYAATPERGAYEARLVDSAAIPVIGVVSYAIGNELLRRYESGHAPAVHIEIRKRTRSDIDYNVIADSPYGDPHHVVVIDAHLDAIYGAGILDNASGSTSILEVALDLAKTRTVNRLRYIWFGGEEIGLLGSRYYTTHLTQEELHDLAFDVDADVTATPNYDILIADPAHATKVKRFPHNVVPESKIGNDYFKDFFDTGGVIARPARFGNDGTDSYAFSLAGVPNSGILTEQDCCKHPWETKVWGGFLGNYEGKIPSFNGGCVDNPHRWCDNLSNNDPFVLELATKAVAYVTFKLAGWRHFPH